MKELSIGKLNPNIDAVAVIMAGGSGTRFWPLSRSTFPKQFLPLAGGDKSLIQVTAERVEPLVTAGGILVVTAEYQRDLVLEHIPHASVLVEPLPRNTAPCIGYAAKKVLRSIGDVPMICLPADHVVQGSEEIRGVYRTAVELARREDLLITIGIKPLLPETGYGYIHRGKAMTGERSGAFSVVEFVEKPDLATAQRYLEWGDYFWNSGMFVWRPSVILAAIERVLPELAAQLCLVDEALSQADGYEQAAAAYASMTPVSIDTGVLEKANNIAMLVGDSFRWSDVGSWSSWADTMLELSADEKRNVAKGDVLLLDSQGCTVVGGKKLIAGVGLSDLIIIDTDDAILVCPRGQSQDVKKVVDTLRTKKRSELL